MRKITMTEAQNDLEMYIELIESGQEDVIYILNGEKEVVQLTAVPKENADEIIDIEQIKEAASPVARKYGVERVSLFGSRSRNEAGKESDYDFVISKGEISSLFQLAAFADELENALGAPVDVVTDTSEDKDFLAEIRKDEIVIYERNKQEP